MVWKSACLALLVIVAGSASLRAQDSGLSDEGRAFLAALQGAGWSGHSSADGVDVTVRMAPLCSSGMLNAVRNRKLLGEEQRKALDDVEAKFELPFDPPPSEPVAVEKPKPEPVELPEKGPEEGIVPIPDDDVETVRSLLEEWAEPEGREWVLDLAYRTKNLSLRELPSERRFFIGYSLLRMAIAGWSDDEILAAVLDHAQVSIGDTVDPAQVLVGMTSSHARRLHDVVEELVHDRLTFSVRESDARLRVHRGATTDQEV